ncbi:YjjG family noncanonical pyrimidine nucleotidase [Fructobacillus ficulneus]|uniref:Hydrolase, HAD superfamily protein n=1 Tax=Fructobacillus ficulneus TaxID=157463 RepID=A0A0K8MIT7_9LACO|nr:YjjG family noncanonical pyrimidine nucleotidase [Fructobacillus ficulneus]GAP00383.1 hydrolase, HAD superfamily protein [Fructobacillus ficulneus]
MYQYLIFDLDDTLLDFTGGEIAGIKSLFQDKLAIPADQVDQALATYQEINHGLWHQYEQDEIPRQQIFDTRFALTLAALKIDGDAAELENEYAYLRNHNFRLLPYATDVLKNLSSDHTIIAGTNGQEATQLLRLKETGLDQYFDQIYTSEGVGASKPDTEFFDKIFKDNPGMNADNTVMIGDGLGSDILGGQNYDLDTIWLNAKGQDLPADLHPTHQVTNLVDLEKVFN